MRVMEYLLKAVRDAAAFCPEIQAALACILWQGRNRQKEVAE